MATIKNPMTGKPVEIRVAEMNDGIAGRTKDSTLDKMTVYIDPVVPEAMYRSLVVHEYTELDRLLKGDTYETAHRDATKNEKTCAEKHGADWGAYNRNYLKLLRRVERRGGTNPPDLFEGEEGEKPLEKMTRDENGRCHDDKGHLTSCGNASSEPSKPEPKPGDPDFRKPTGVWTPKPKKPGKGPSQEKPKPKEPDKPQALSYKPGPVPQGQKAPRLRPGFDPKKTVKGPRGAGKSNFPNVPLSPTARKELQSLVGHEVDITYSIHHEGRDKAEGRPTLMVNNISIAGTNIVIHHMWIPHPTPEQLKLKPGDRETATGDVGEYLYHDPDTRAETKNFEVGSLRNTKSVPKAAQKGADIADIVTPGGQASQRHDIKVVTECRTSDGKLTNCGNMPPVDKMVRDENGRCHDDKGHLTSCGDATTEPSGDKPGAPKDQPAPGKPPAKPAESESQKPESTRHEPEIPKLESHVRQSLGDYTTAEHAFVNAYLRFPPKDGKVPKQYAEMTRNIDEAMEKTGGLKGDEVVYRGINYKAAFGKTPVESLKGAIIQDPGFVSTSLDREKAKQFGDAVFTLRVPKGTKAVRMQDYIHTTTTEAEKEILLHRGVKYQITHIREEKGGFLGLGKKIYIDARVVE